MTRLALISALAVLLLAGSGLGACRKCSSGLKGSANPESPMPTPGDSAAGSERAADPYGDRREAMVKKQIQARGVKDPRVLAAMLKVPRHEFVPEGIKRMAYTDQPLPIGLGQTISQPYIVAYMTEALELKPTDKVLEIGTGSGYQAAVLAETAGEVYSIEILCELERRARSDLDRLGYNQVVTRCGDGYQGWPEQAPFDAVIVTAAPDQIPGPLVDQLAVGGRMVIPVGKFDQELIRLRKTEEGVTRETLLPVRFVPMTGQAEEK